MKKLLPLLCCVLWWNDNAQTFTKKYHDDFEFFWQTINNNYCYIDKKHVDRAKLNPIYEAQADTVSCCTDLYPPCSKHCMSCAIIIYKGNDTQSQKPLYSNLKISHLTGNFYVYTTYNYYKGKRISANGMYLLTNKGVIMFDSPWDTTQFQPLLDSIRIKHNNNVIMCLATHFHEDRTGGLEYYKQQGIKTYTTTQTDELSREKGMKRAAFLINNDTVFTVGQYSFQTYFPGQGHAPDNIVIWFEKEKILYGGCLIKSVEDNSLGNLSDANIKEYAATIKNVQEKCRKPKYIITGHNDWTSTKSLKHTLKMAKKLK